MSVDLTLKMATQRISHTWMTKIQKTIEGGEKRSALFTWPRIKLDNSIKIKTDEERRFLGVHLWRDLHNLWNIPIVSDEAILTASAVSGQKIITIDATGYRHFYDGRKCILISPDDWESYEIAIIDSVDSATQITATINLASSWPSGTKIYPLYECRVRPEQSRTSDYWKINTAKLLAIESFETDRDFSYTLPTIDTDVFPIYNSLNLFLTPSLRPVTEKYRHPYETMGTLGKQTTFSTYGDTRAIFNRSFQYLSKKEIYDILNFFDAKQGRFGIFYIPTWLENITISSGFDAADVTISVKKLYYTTAEIVGRHIYIRLPDKSYVCREIIARPSETSITFNSAIGITVLTADLPDMLCCFLYEARFNIDEIVFDYQPKKDMAKTELSFNIL